MRAWRPMKMRMGVDPDIEMVELASAVPLDDDEITLMNAKNERENVGEKKK